MPAGRGELYSNIQVKGFILMQVSSFTLKFPGKAREIITDVSVYDSI